MKFNFAKFLFIIVMAAAITAFVMLWASLFNQLVERQ